MKVLNANDAGKKEIAVSNYVDWLKSGGNSCACLSGKWANGHEHADVMRLFSDFYISELLLSIMYLRQIGRTGVGGSVAVLLKNLKESRPDEWMKTATSILIREDNEEEYRAISVIGGLFSRSSAKLDNLLLRYLVRIVSGEARYWGHILKPSKKLGEVKEFLETCGLDKYIGSDKGRDQASSAEHVPCPICDPWRCAEYLVYVYKVFTEWTWGRDAGATGFGGNKWGHITEVALSRVLTRANLMNEGVIPFIDMRTSMPSEKVLLEATEIGNHPSSYSASQFIDYVVDLQHNGGSIFNKRWLNVSSSVLHNWLNIKKMTREPLETIKAWENLYQTFRSHYPNPLSTEGVNSSILEIALTGQKPILGVKKQMSSSLRRQLEIAKLYENRKEVVRKEQSKQKARSKKVNNTEGKEDLTIQVRNVKNKKITGTLKVPQLVVKKQTGIEI